MAGTWHGWLVGGMVGGWVGNKPKQTVLKKDSRRGNNPTTTPPSLRVRRGERANKRTTTQTN